MDNRICIEIPSFTDAETGRAVTELEHFLTAAGCVVTDKAPQTVRFAGREIADGGYRIVSDGRTATICAADGYGRLYGAYALLEKSVGFRVYAADEIALSPWQGLPVIDITETPSFPLRMYNCADVYYDKTLQDRMRMRTEIWAGPGSWFHTTFGYLPPETYAAAHPSWYGGLDEKGKTAQLCYSTLLRDPEAYDAFFAAVVKVLEKHPDKPNLSVTHEDNIGWCDCPDCRASRERYGTDAAVLIRFINKLARDVGAWCRLKNRPAPTVVFFAYYATVEPPVTETADGIRPIDDDLYVDGNAGVIYAPIDMDYGVPVTDPVNGIHAERMRKWAAVCKKLYVWTYQTNFSYYLVNSDSISVMPANYRFARDLVAYLYYDQGQTNNCHAVCFSELRTFLTANLLWNVDRDMTQLTDSFFRHYFGEASVPMRKFFDEMLENHRRWHEQVTVGKEWYIYFKIVRPDVWPRDTLDRWLGYLDEAYAAVQTVSDSVRRETLFNRVRKESVSVRYLYLRLYGGDRQEKQRLIDDVREIGTTRLCEGKPIDALTAELLAADI